MLQFVLTDRSVIVYPIMLISAVLIGYVLTVILLRIQKVDLEYIIYSIMINLVLMIFGGVAFNILSNPSILKNLSFPYIIPMSSVGAGLGMLLGTLAISVLIPFFRNEFLYSYGLCVPLIYSVSKIGCFFAGCCEGILYEGIFAVDYSLKSKHSGIRFPVQLAETIVFLVIFCVFLFLFIYRKNIYLVPLLLMFSAISKFFLDFLRNEHVGKVITVNQFACIIFVLIAGIWLYIIYRSKQKCLTA